MQVDRTEVSDGPWLERLGARLFEVVPMLAIEAKPDDALHWLKPDEQEALRGIEKRVLWRAILAGAFSGAVAGGAERLFRLVMDIDDPWKNWHEHWAYWASVGAVILVATVLELTYLYWNTLRAVKGVAAATGAAEVSGAREPLLTRGLIRTALELPNPRMPLYGVDPYRDVSRARLVVSALAYKAKVGVTNVILKIIVRRLLSRTALRSWVPFVAKELTTSTWKAGPPARTANRHRRSWLACADPVLGGAAIRPQCYRL